MDSSSNTGALITFDDVFEAICAFKEATGQEPKQMHLTKHEIDCLKQEALKCSAVIRERDLIGDSDYIYGVQIVESETEGYLLA